MLMHDHRWLGAVLALLVDGLLLAIGALLAAAGGLPAATYPLFGGLTGILVAPLVGWRYGPVAAERPAAQWLPRAVIVATALGLVEWLCLWAVLLVVQGPPNHAQPLGFAAVLAYEVGVAFPVVALVVTLPCALAWSWLMRRLTGRSTGATAHTA
jgi:hypothetical protein